MTTTIYEATKSPSVTKEAPSTKNLKWNLEDFHPTGFISKERGTDNLYGLLVHTEDLSAYQWISNSPKHYRGTDAAGKEVYVPYDYEKLLKRFTPHLFYCFWDSSENKVIQVDKKALFFGHFRYRHLSIRDFNSYIFAQTKRARTLLNPDGDTVIGRVFNTKWMDGNRDNIFPVRASRTECETHLPQWHETKQGFYLPEVRHKIIPQMHDREPVHRSVIVHSLYSFNTNHDMPLLIEKFQHLIGTRMTAEDLQHQLDEVGYRMGIHKGRVTTAIKELKQEGIALNRKKVRTGKKTFNIYEVKRVGVDLVQEECQQLS
ncbi:hypothetical protein OAE26_02075 [Synechococcus sp. AH-551-E05]|nr:hypothetical protein [Synechococcus sp. AH-551-E05]MDB4651342.1 hypothetical protein [Synechococcus sp. AH-551-E05]